MKAVGQLSNTQKGRKSSCRVQMHCLPRRLEETHQHAAKVLDNNESAFVEETVDQEKAKRMAGQVLGHSLISICPVFIAV